jgi:cobalamin biosynthesis protein CbiG
MKKYIENIRISLKKQGYAPTSEVIRKAIHTICPDGKNILDNKLAIVNEVTRLLALPNNLTLKTDIEDSLQTENAVNEPEEASETEIVVGTKEKHDFIISQASCLGIELSDVEVVELATEIKDCFLNHETFIDEVVTAVVTYHDQRSDSLEQKIRDARKHIENRRRQLNQTLVGEFGDMNSFFRQGAAKRRELSKTIADVFQT